MKKAYISPVTSLLISLSLVAGIFVAGLTNSELLPAAKAQTMQYVTVGASNTTLAGSVITVRGVVINGVATDALIPGGVRISNSAVNSSCGLTALGFNSSGEIVYALGVYTSGNDNGDIPPGPNGVYTSGNDDDDTPAGPNGVYTSGNDDDDIPPGSNGVYTSGNDDDDVPAGPNGVYTSGNDDDDTPAGPNGVYTSGNVYVGNSLQVVGGVLSGSNIQIIDGVISGSNLQVTGGYVTGTCGN